MTSIQRHQSAIHPSNSHVFRCFLPNSSEILMFFLGFSFGFPRLFALISHPAQPMAPVSWRVSPDRPPHSAAPPPSWTWATQFGGFGYKEKITIEQSDRSFQLKSTMQICIHRKIWSDFPSGIEIPIFVCSDDVDLLVGGIPTTLKKYEFVNWDDDIPSVWKHIKCSKPSTS